MMPTSHWSLTKLGDVTDWASGGTPRKGEPSYWNGDIPWISASSMKSERLTDSDLKLTEAGLKNGSRIADRDSVLLLVRGSELHKRIPIGIAGRPVAFNQDVKALKPREGLLPNYLLYWLVGNEPLLLSKVEHTGIGAGKLDTVVMKNLPLRLPPLEEQETIASVLGSLDDKIELNRRMNETLEALGRALFKSWFVDFDPVRAKMEGRQPAGMDDETAALFPDSFEDSALGEIPKGWEVMRVDDVLELAYGKALKATDRVPGTVPVYGSNDQIGWHNEELVEGPGIIVGRKGNPGIVTWSHTQFFPIDTTFFVVPTGPIASMNYLFHALQLQNLPHLSADSAVPGLNRNFAYGNPIIVPSAELLNRFDAHIDKLSSLTQVNLRQSRTLAAIRDALLPKLLSGEVRVGEPDEIVEGTV